MIQYYKLVLVRAGRDRRLFKRILKAALAEIKDKEELDKFKTWLRQTQLMVNRSEA